MRSAIVLVLFAALAALGGCRREDVREMTVLMPELKEADRAKVAESLAKYQGVLKDSYDWDMSAKTLTLKGGAAQTGGKATADTLVLDSAASAFSLASADNDFGTAQGTAASVTLKDANGSSAPTSRSSSARNTRIS